jgi:hypothetical protein
VVRLERLTLRCFKKFLEVSYAIFHIDGCRRGIPVRVPNVNLFYVIGIVVETVFH